MTSDEYHNMREENTKEWIIEELEKRGFEKGLANFNLRTLRESLLKDQIVASRTHVEWQPAEVQEDLCFLSVSVCSKQRYRKKTSSRQVLLGEFCELIYGKAMFIGLFFLFLEFFRQVTQNLLTIINIINLRITLRVLLSACTFHRALA